MSLHKKDWLSLLALGGLGAATGGFGLLGGGLLGGTAAAATTALPEGLGIAGADLMPMLGTPMAETAMLAPPQMAVEQGLLGKLGDFAGSKESMNALRLANMAGGQQQAAPPPMMPRPVQQQQVQQPPQPMTDQERFAEEMKRRRAFGSYLGNY